MAVSLAAVLLPGLLVAQPPCPPLPPPGGSTVEVYPAQAASLRGIVAAAVSSVFALALADFGIGDSDRLLSLTFFTISGTVVIYAALAPIAARALGLVEADAQGVLFVGAPAWARDAAKVLIDLGFRAQMVDSDYFRVRQARMENIPALYGSAITERTEQSLDLRGIGRLLAVTANDDANSLAALHFSELFGRSEVSAMCSNRTCHAPGEGRIEYGLQDHKDPAKVQQFHDEWLGRVRPNGRAITKQPICTDCHGTHRIDRAAKDEKFEARGEQKGLQEDG